MFTGESSVRIDVSCAASTATLDAARHDQGATTRQHEQCILIVDDAPELLSLLRKVVVRMGYQVETASRAIDALATLEAKPVDLLLTDWSMPEMNGGELIMAMKEKAHLRDIPTIVLTCYDTDKVRQAAENAGGDGFLLKPVMRDELHYAINKLLPG